MRPLPVPKVRSRQINDGDIDGVVELLTRGFRLRTRDYWQRALEKLASHRTPPDMPKFGYLSESGRDIVGVVAYFLIGRYGMIGAAWGRLAAEVFGFGSALLLTRWAFPVPLPLNRVTRVFIAAMVMAIVVRGLETALVVSDRDALAVLIPAGMASYLAMCWLLDIARSRHRLSRCLLIARARLAPLTRPR